MDNVFTNPIGEILLKEGLISKEQLEKVLNHQNKSGRLLGDILIELGYISQEDLKCILARQQGIPKFDFSTQTLVPNIVRIIPVELALRHKIIAVSKKDDSLVVAMAEPTNILLIDEIRQKCGLNIEPVFATDLEIRDAIAKYYNLKWRL